MITARRLPASARARGSLPVLAIRVLAKEVLAKEKGESCLYQSDAVRSWRGWGLWGWWGAARHRHPPPPPKKHPPKPLNRGVNLAPGSSLRLFSRPTAL